ncbi:MAG: hypothetical protein HRT90_10420, partial [Candidatus Margulisbacteria bacterium]|nr:hypothetical protein [Candidatus Margulisiibacteriota bacterium]
KWKNGKQHGRGEVTYANKDTITGMWNELKILEGHGAYTYKNGRYEGHWRDDKENGRGKMTYTNGDIYDGEWKDGRVRGHGTLTFSANGEVIKGVFDRTDTIKKDNTYLLICKQDDGTTRVMKKVLGGDFTIIDPIQYDVMFKTYAYNPE